MASEPTPSRLVGNRKSVTVKEVMVTSCSVRTEREPIVGILTQLLTGQSGRRRKTLDEDSGIRRTRHVDIGGSQCPPPRAPTPLASQEGTILHLAVACRPSPGRTTRESLWRLRRSHSGANHLTTPGFMHHGGVAASPRRPLDARLERKPETAFRLSRLVMFERRYSAITT